MNKAKQLKNALLLRCSALHRAIASCRIRPVTVACGQGSDVAEKNLHHSDTKLYSVCKFNDLFLAFSAGACSMAIAVMAVLTFTRSFQCN